MGSDLARYSKSVANLGTRNFGERTSHGMLSVEKLMFPKRLNLCIRVNSHSLAP
jgi:hypothetical protein